MKKLVVINHENQRVERQAEDILIEIKGDWLIATLIDKYDPESQSAYFFRPVQVDLK